MGGSDSVYSNWVELDFLFVEVGKNFIVILEGGMKMVINFFGEFF